MSAKCDQCDQCDQSAKPAFVTLPRAACRVRGGGAAAAAAAASIGAVMVLAGTATQARAAGSFSFVQISNTQIDGADASSAHTAKVRQDLQAFAGLNDKPAFILDAGSVTERGTAAQFATFRQIVSADLPKNLPLYAVPGSGDVRWSLPAADAFQRESGQPRYRSFDYDGVHFILLDSTVGMETLGHVDQAQMNWLKADISSADKGDKKSQRPVIVCFHHAAGQQPAVIDNQEDLFQTFLGYNMRLYLCGQGQAAAVGNINGVPVVSSGAAFDGSYNLVKISKNKLEVYQRTVGDTSTAQAAPILSESLRWSGSPAAMARVGAQDNTQLNVTIDKQEFPKDTVFTCCLDGGAPVPMTPPTVPDNHVGWTASLPLAGVASGEHRVLVLISYPDSENPKIENVYRLSLPLRLFGTGSIKPKWSVDLKTAIQGEASSDADQVYVPTMGGTLYALDANTGERRWPYSTGGSLYSAPALSGDAVYFGSCDGNVNAVDRKTGGSIWKAALGAPILAGVTVVGKVVCVPMTNGSIVGLDVASGRELWRTRDNGGVFRSRAATDGTNLFIGDWTGHFRSLSAATGQEAWSVAVGHGEADAPVVASPTVDLPKMLVYVGSLDGTLHALDIKTGAEKWKVERPSMGYSKPTLSSTGFLYSASRTDNGQIYAFNSRTGDETWSKATGFPIYEASCCAADANICIGTVDGTFSTLYGARGVALGKAGGDVNWQYHLPPGHLLASPVVNTDPNNKQVYVGNLSGVFAAFPGSIQTPTP